MNDIGIEVEDEDPRQSYTEEFKREAVKLVQAGNKPSAVVKQLGVSKTTLSNWHKAALFYSREMRRHT